MFYSQKIVKKTKLIEDKKNDNFYRKVLDLFPDAELLDVELKDDE